MLDGFNALKLGAELGAAFGRADAREFHTFQEADGAGRERIQVTITENPPRGKEDGETLAEAAARFMAEAEQEDGRHVFHDWLVSECRYSEVYAGQAEPAFNSVTITLIDSPLYGEKQA